MYPIEYKDSVSDQTTTTGTGTVTITGIANTGCRTIASAHTTGATIHYRIQDSTNTNWEVGEGVWTSSGSTLTRVTISASSNSGSLVSFASGTKTVMTGMGSTDIQSLCTRTLPITITGTLLSNPNITFSSPRTIVVNNILYWFPNERFSYYYTELTPMPVGRTIGLTTFNSSSPALGILNLQQCPLLTSVNLSTAKYIYSVLLDQLPILTTINFSSAIGFNDITLSYLPSITSVSFSSTIETIDNLILSFLSTCTSISFPVLVNSPITIDHFPLLTSIYFPLLQYSNDLFISYCDILTSISFPSLTTGESINIIYNNSLTSISFAVLTACTGDSIIQFCPLLTSISAPSLLYTTQSLTIQENATLATISFPALVALNNGIIIDFLPLLSSLSLPSLTYANILMIGDIYEATNNLPLLTSISFPVLDSIVSFSCGGKSITSFYLPLLTKIDSFLIYDTLATSISLPALLHLGTFDLLHLNTTPSSATTVSFNSGLLSVTGSIQIDYPLTQVSVDGILASLVALNGSSGTTLFNSGVVALEGLCSAPSSTGYTNAATLVARGVTVTTN